MLRVPIDGNMADRTTDNSVPRVGLERGGGTGNRHIRQEGDPLKDLSEKDPSLLCRFEVTVGTILGVIIDYPQLFMGDAVEVRRCWVFLHRLRKRVAEKGRGCDASFPGAYKS